MSVWDVLEHFSVKEAWGEPGKINGLLLLLLETIRTALGYPIIIHCGTQGVHTKNSQHYLGNAVDFHFDTITPFPEQVSKLLKVLSALQVSDRVGLGVYPDWNNPGFHLDVRGYAARWGRIGSDYVSFNKVLEYLRRRG